MRFIPTWIHGILDYVLGILLISAPWLLGFGVGGAETWTPVVIGSAIVVYSLLTNYELGVVRVIPVRAHLWFDGIGGFFLAWSPTVFGYSGLVWVPHVLVGIILILAAFFTRTRPARRFWPAR